MSCLEDIYCALSTVIRIRLILNQLTLTYDQL